MLVLVIVISVQHVRVRIFLQFSSNDMTNYKYSLGECDILESNWGPNNSMNVCEFKIEPSELGFTLAIWDCGGNFSLLYCQSISHILSHIIVGGSMKVKVILLFMLLHLLGTCYNEFSVEKQNIKHRIQARTWKNMEYNTTKFKKGKKKVRKWAYIW